MGRGAHLISTDIASMPVTPKITVPIDIFVLCKSIFGIRAFFVLPFGFFRALSVLVLILLLFSKRVPHDADVVGPVPFIQGKFGENPFLGLTSLDEFLNDHSISFRISSAPSSSCFRVNP